MDVNPNSPAIPLGKPSFKPVESSGHPAPQLSTSHTTSVASQAVQALIGLKGSADKEVIISAMEISMKAWASTVCERLGLDINIVEPLLPKLVDSSEITRLQANDINTHLVKVSPEKQELVLKSLPEYLLPCLPEETLKVAFTDSEIEQIKLSPADNPHIAAAYYSSTHIIGFNEKNIIQAGEISGPELGAHEMNHGLNSLFRSMLSPKDLEKSVIEGLKDEIVNGSLGGIGLISRGYPTFIPDIGMRSELGNLFEELAQNKDDERLFIDEFKDGSVKIDIPKLSDKGKAFVLDIAKRHPAFMELCSNDETTAISLLSRMFIDLLFKFNMANGQITSGAPSITLKEELLGSLPSHEREELKKAIYANPPALEFAKNSARKYSEVQQSGILIPHITNSPVLYIQYAFCNEEIESYIAGAASKLATGDNNTEEIGRLSTTIDLFNTGKEYVEKLRSLSLLPQNLELAKHRMHLIALRHEHSEELRKIELFIEKEVNPLSTTMHELENAEQDDKRFRHPIEHSSSFKGSIIISEYNEEKYSELRQHRDSILECLRKNGHPCQELTEATEKEKQLFGEIKKAQEGLTEADFYPTACINDEAILKEVEDLEKKLIEIQRTAQFHSFKGFQPLIYKKPSTATFSEIKVIPIDDLPPEILARFKAAQS
jgi:hypothetical protein